MSQRFTGAGIFHASIFQPTIMCQAVLSASALMVSTASTAATLDIPAQPLDQAVTQLAQKTGLKIGGDSSLLHGKQAPAVRGELQPEQALKQLLKGSGIDYQFTDRNTVILRQKPDTTELDTLTVKGKELRFGDAPVEPGGFKAEYQTTATKMAMELKETPQAISVVTRDLLDLRQVDNLVHALELTSGTLGGSGNFAAPSGPFTGRSKYSQGYNVRGYALDYYHGVKTDGFSAGTVADIDLAAYERVEVVKGPSGFFGTGPIGGAINLVRKKPQAEFDASISGQAGSFDTYRTEADITGALTEDESLRARLVMAYGDEGSFVNDVATETTLIAPNFEAVINDKTRVLLQLRHQEEEFDASNGQPVYMDGDRVKLFDLPRSYHFGANGEERSTSEIKDISLRIDHEISDRWLGRLLLHASETNLDVFQGSYGYLIGDTAYINYGRDITKSERWAGELQLEGVFDAFDQEHRVMFGLERNNRVHERTNGWGYVYDDSGEFAIVNLDKGEYPVHDLISKKDVAFNNKDGEREETDNTALYAQSVISLAEKTKLLVNARYDHSDYNGTDRWGAPWLSKKDKELTTRLGLTQEINDNISVYTAYGESFTPSYSRSRTGVLDAQRGEGYELGVKSDWFDKRLGASLSIYRQDMTNRPLLDPTNQGNDEYYIAAGLHRTEGVELDITGSPLPGLNLSIAATWMDNEFLDKNDDLYGLAINGSAKQQYSFYANYELQQGPLKGLATGLMFLSVGERQVLPYSWRTGYSQAYVDGYERVDLDFSYKALPNLDMSLVIRNVLDEKYLEQGASRFARNQFVGAPRSALFKATYHF